MATQIIPQDILDSLPKQFGQKTITQANPNPSRGNSGLTRIVDVIDPPANAIAITAPVAGRGGPREEPTGEYYIPLDMPDYPKTDAGGYPVPPLVAKYDASGKLQTITALQRYLGDAQNNISIQPEYSLSGELITTAPLNNAEGEGGGFGDFLGSALKDFGPMIALGLGANYLAGSGLLSGGAGSAAAPAAAGTAAASGTGVAGGLMGSTLPAGAGAGGFFAPGITAGAATLGIPTMTGAPAGVAAGIPSGAGGAGMLSAPPVGAPPVGGTPVGGAPVGAPPVGAPPVSGASVGGAPPVDSSILSAISSATGISVDNLKTFAPSVIQGLLGAGGSYLASEQGKEAAKTQADAQIEAARIAADAAGNVIGAGYTPSAEITGYQDRLRTLAGQGLTDAEGARAAFQPLTTAAQSLFGLGQGYLAKTPEQAAADYISKQQALIAPSQENQLALLQNKLFQQGRGGAATAQGGSLMATSPELAAYYNSLAQSNLVLAAQADQEAQNRIKFGAGLFDTGANLQGRFYTGQTAALAPFTTAMDTSSALESLAERPLGLGIELGGKVSSAAGRAGAITGQGITNAASTMAPANAYSGAGNLFSGFAQSPNFSSALGQAFGVPQPKPSQDAYGAVTFRQDPFTGEIKSYRSTFS